MSDKDPRPFIVLTVVLNAEARVADLTCSHGDAWERALAATEGKEIAGLEIVELPVSLGTFSSLRKQLERPKESVGFYDLFPLADLEEETRKVAGQFLAAESLWTLADQGLLGDIALNVRVDVPKGWDRNPSALQERLVNAGALDLSAEAVETFKQVKQAWDASTPMVKVVEAVAVQEAEAVQDLSAQT